jgi:hypothetical protein
MLLDRLIMCEGSKLGVVGHSVEMPRRCTTILCQGWKTPCGLSGRRVTVRSERGAGHADRSGNSNSVQNSRESGPMAAAGAARFGTDPSFRQPFNTM